MSLYRQDDSYHLSISCSMMNGIDRLEESTGLLWLEGLLVHLAAGTRLATQQTELDGLVMELQSVGSLAFTGLNSGRSDDLN